MTSLTKNDNYHKFIVVYRISTGFYTQLNVKTDRLMFKLFNKTVRRPTMELLQFAEEIGYRNSFCLNSTVKLVWN